MLLRDIGMHRETRGYAEALDAAGCVVEGRKDEQEDQREGELCAPQHLVQCSVRGEFRALAANSPRSLRPE